MYIRLAPPRLPYGFGGTVDEAIEFNGTIIANGTYVHPKGSPAVTTRGHYVGTHPRPEQAAVGHDSDPPYTPPSPPRALQIYPEMDLDVVVDDVRDASKPKTLRIPGKADWAFTHGGRVDSSTGSVMLAVAAKSPYTISEAKYQLLTYLSTVRALKKQHGEINGTVQGFCSDGFQYCFLSIDGAGAVYTSRVYDTGIAGELQTIYNWMVTMLETATRPGPNAIPPKPGMERDAEIGQPNYKVFLRLVTTCKEESETLDDLDLDERCMVLDEILSEEIAI